MDSLHSACDLTKYLYMIYMWFLLQAFKLTYEFYFILFYLQWNE